MTGETAPTSGQNNSKFMLWLGIGCVGPVLLIMIMIIVVLAWPKDNSPKAGDAVQACESIVRAQLVAPSTADFNSAVSGSGPWTVVGSVNSQNGFGATLTADYQCTVTGLHAVLDYLQ